MYMHRGQARLSAHISMLETIPRDKLAQFQCTAALTPFSGDVQEGKKFEAEGGKWDGNSN